MDHRSFRRAHSSADAPQPRLADDDPIGVSVNLDRPANGAGADRVFVIVKPTHPRHPHVRDQAGRAGVAIGFQEIIGALERLRDARPITLAYSPAIFCWPLTAPPSPAPTISCACSTRRKSIARALALRRTHRRQPETPNVWVRGANGRRVS